MGVGDTPLICHLPQDVPAHHQVRAERGGKACLPRPPGQYVETWPGDRPICLETSGVLDLSQGDLGHLPQCLSVGKVSRSPPCGPQWRRKAICDILSSQLHQLVYPTAAREAWEPMDECQSRPIRISSYEEALQEIRAVHQRALETAKMLRSDIERLSWGVRDAPWTWSQSHSRRHSRSHSRSHSWGCSLDRWLRSPSRSQQGRRVTFQELEVEPDPKGIERITHHSPPSWMLNCG